MEATCDLATHSFLLYLGIFYPFVGVVFLGYVARYCKIYFDNISSTFARYIHAGSTSIVLLRRPKMCHISGELSQTPRSSNKFLIELHSPFFQDFEGCNRNFPNYHAQGLSFLSTEAKVAAGTDIVKQSLRAFVPPSMSTVMLVDLMSYDAFPALAALEDSLATCK